MKNSLMAILLIAVLTTTTEATLIQFTDCTGANSCIITISPPNPIVANPNSGVLLAWDEVQNIILTDDLSVDRVFDDSATFVESSGSGDYIIKAGTVISSHYFQWDPGEGSSKTVSATIQLDAAVFAFITSDNNLFNSDDFLGLSGLDYANFTLRGLEGKDITSFNGSYVDISWKASKPGDWARLITAFSPSASHAVSSPVPEPNMLFLIASLILVMNFFRLTKVSYKSL